MLMSMGKIFGTAKKRSPWPGGLLEEVVAMAGLTVVIENQCVFSDKKASFTSSVQCVVTRNFA